MNNLVKKSALATLVAAAVVTLSACEHKYSLPNNGTSVASSGAISAQSSFEDKAAYAIGASLGEYVYNMKQSQEQFIGNLPTNVVIAGFNDGVNKVSILKREEIENVLKDLDKKIQEQLEAKAKQSAADNLAAGEAFLAENAKKEGVVVTESGLQYKVISKGDGPTAKKGDTILVTYRGSTIDGGVFDEQKKPVEFPLDNMIPGWIEGLELMNVGSEYELYIPAKLGYGDNAVSQLIKPNSVLIFDVKLVDIKKETKAQESAQKK